MWKRERERERERERQCVQIDIDTKPRRQSWKWQLGKYVLRTDCVFVRKEREVEWVSVGESGLVRVCV